MENENSSKIIGVRNGITYRVDTSPENNTPEKIQQRLRTLLKLAIDIGRREGLIGTGMTLKQAKEVLNRWSLEIEHKDGHPISIPAKAESSEVIEPAVKEIRVRLPKNQWGQIGQVARRLRISHTALAYIWIVEGLNRRI